MAAQVPLQPSKAQPARLSVSLHPQSIHSCAVPSSRLVFPLLPSLPSSRPGLLPLPGTTTPQPVVFPILPRSPEVFCYDLHELYLPSASHLDPRILPITRRPSFPRRSHPFQPSTSSKGRRAKRRSRSTTNAPRSAHALHVCSRELRNHFTASFFQSGHVCRIPLESPAPDLSSSLARSTDLALLFSGCETGRSSRLAPHLNRAHTDLGRFCWATVTARPSSSSASPAPSTTSRLVHPWAEGRLLCMEGAVLAY